MQDILTCYKSKVVSGDQIVHCMIILFLLMGISILIDRSFAVHLPTYKDHGRSFQLSFCRQSWPSSRPHKKAFISSSCKGKVTAAPAFTSLCQARNKFLASNMDFICRNKNRLVRD